MILEYFDTQILDGFLLLIPGILISIIGAAALFNLRKVHQKIGSILMLLIGLALVEECIYSGYVRPDQPPVISVTKHPVELRQENNTLYVFFQGSLNKVSGYTSEYIKENDTMYVYLTETIGGRLSWGQNEEITFKPKINIVWRDSVDITVETGKTTLTPDDFELVPTIEPELDIRQQNDSLAH